MAEKVVIGMSGGVDSSVAAFLLKEQGYDVLGVTMLTWRKTDDDEAVKDAKKVAEKLGIPFFTVDFRQEFKKYVMDYFASEYKAGRTPNPCTVCNRFVKWEALIKKAKEFGADFIATGHYARIDRHPVTGRLVIRDSVTAKKDQTYALYNLTQEQLKSTLMPIGNYEKDEIRQIAARIGLEVAEKGDSQDICFIPDNDYVAFLERKYGYKAKKGNYVDLAGKPIGEHKGIVNYTIGQRKGLGVSFGKHMFVTKIKPETNEIVLGDNDDLFKKTVYADNVNLMAVDKIEGDIRLTAKIRYAHKKTECTVRMGDDGILECVFDEPQRAPTPGQALVLYDGEYVFGGGTIIDAK